MLHSRLIQWLTISAGGALGTLCRHLFNLSTLGADFPVGTLLENFFGSFFLGVLAGWVAQRPLKQEWVNHGVGIGFCGGFTTMSTLALDSVLLAHEVSRLSASIYIIASLFLGISAVFIGYKLGNILAERQLPPEGMAQ